MWYIDRAECTTIFAQMTSYGVITNDVIHFDVIYYPFPVNSQYLRTSRVDSLGLV